MNRSLLLFISLGAATPYSYAQPPMPFNPSTNPSQPTTPPTPSTTTMRPEIRQAMCQEHYTGCIEARPRLCRISNTGVETMMSTAEVNVAGEEKRTCIQVAKAACHSTVYTAREKCIEDGRPACDRKPAKPAKLKVDCLSELNKTCVKTLPAIRAKCEEPGIKKCEDKNAEQLKIIFEKRDAAEKKAKEEEKRCAADTTGCDKERTDCLNPR